MVGDKIKEVDEVKSYIVLYKPGKMFVFYSWFSGKPLDVFVVVVVVFVVLIVFERARERERKCKQRTGQRERDRISSRLHAQCRARLGA